jgi:hypothetical protein
MAINPLSPPRMMLSTSSLKKQIPSSKPKADEEVIRQLREEGALKLPNTFTIKRRDGNARFDARLPRHSMSLYTIEMSDLKK